MARTSDINLDLHSEVARHDVRLQTLEASTQRIDDLARVTTRLEEIVGAQARRLEYLDAGLDATVRDVSDLGGKISRHEERAVAANRRSGLLMRTTRTLTDATTRLEASTSSYVTHAASTAKTLSEAVDRLATIEKTQARHSNWWVTLWLVTSAIGALVGAVLSSSAADWIKRMSH